MVRNLAVCLEVGRLVDQRILTAQLFFDVLEADGHVFDALGKEGASAGGFRHFV